MASAAVPQSKHNVESPATINEDDDENAVYDWLLLQRVSEVAAKKLQEQKVAARHLPHLTKEKLESWLAFGDVMDVWKALESAGLVAPAPVSSDEEKKNADADERDLKLEKIMKQQVQQSQQMQQLNTTLSSLLSGRTYTGSQTFSEVGSNITAGATTLDPIQFLKELQIPLSTRRGSTDYELPFKVEPRTVKMKLDDEKEDDEKEEEVEVNNKCKEAIVQAYVIDQLQKFVHWKNRSKNDTVKLYVKDTHNNRYLDGRQPDGGIFVNDYVSSLGVVEIIEIKTPRRRFSNADRGELYTFLERLLKCQPLRTFAIGLLTDGFQVQAMLVKRGKACVTLSDAVPFTDPKARKFLVSLVEQVTPEQLGYVPPPTVSMGSVQLKEALSAGSTGVVYKCTAEEEDKEEVHALKVFNKSVPYDNEKKMLELLKGPHVPAVYAVDDEARALRMPLLKPFKFRKNHPSAQNWKELLCVLRRAHSKGVVHRDVSPSNIMADKDDALQLIDWAFAVETQPQSVAAYARFSGSVAFGSRELLKKIAAGDARPAYTSADDLESVVRVAHHFVTGSQVLRKKDESTQVFAARSLNSWKEILEKSKMWSDFAAAAQARDYELNGLPTLFYALEDPPVVLT